jgi:hypothetical protein
LSQAGNDFREMKTRTRPLLQAARILTAGLLLACPSQGWAASSDDRKSILGVWRGGMPGDPPGSIELTITPTRITGRNPRTGESLGEGSYELDPARKTIDPHKAAKFGRGRTYLGRYSIDGNTLRWVSNSRGSKRPADLAHRPERDQFLMVLERVR